MTIIEGIKLNFYRIVVIILLIVKVYASVSIVAGFPCGHIDNSKNRTARSEKLIIAVTECSKPQKVIEDLPHLSVWIISMIFQLNRIHTFYPIVESNIFKFRALL